MEESWDDEDEQLIHSSSVLSSPSSHPWHDQDDPLSLTSDQEVDRNCGETVINSQTRRRGLRRRKGGKVVSGQGESGVTKRIKSSSHPTIRPSCSSSSKNAIKILVSPIQDVIVKKEVIVKVEDDSSDYHEQNQDNFVITSFSSISEPPSSKKEEGKITGAGDLTEKRGETKRKTSSDPFERRRAQKRDNERKRKKKANETPAQREARLKRDRERKRNQRESRSQQRQNETEEEMEERKKRRREYIARKRAVETEAEKEQRLERGRQRRANESESKRKERHRKDATAKYFAWEAKKASLSPEELEKIEFERNMNIYLRRMAWQAKFTPEEWKEKQKKKKKFAALPVEKKKVIMAKRKAYMERIPVERKKKYQQTAVRNYMNRAKQDPAKWEQLYGKMIQANRNKIARETPEERQKRLLRYKVYQAKRKAKIQMEEEGLLTEAEIQRRLEEVVRQVEEKDRLERANKPVDTAEYKPRENARKPKKKSKAENAEIEFRIKETCPPHSPSVQDSPQKQQEFPSSSKFNLHVEVEDWTESDSQDAPVSPSPAEEESSWVDNVPDHDDDHDHEDHEDHADDHDDDDEDHEDHADDHDDDDEDHADDHDESDAIETENLSGNLNVKEEVPTSPISTPPSPSAHIEDEQVQALPTTSLKVEKVSEVDEEVTSHSHPVEKIKVELENRAICEECGKCLYPQSMKVHKHLFHNPSKVSSFKCPKCSKEFASSHRLWDHYLNIHDEEKKVLAKESSAALSTNAGPFICEQCGKEYSQKANLETHVKHVHLGERIICEICGKEEQSQGKLWRHKIAKHPELKTPPPKGMIICQYCSEPVLRSLFHHVKKTHPDKYQEFIDSGAHIVPGKKKVRKMTKCVECDKELRLDDMKRHMRNIHGHGSKAIPCPHCGKEFQEGHKVTEHIRRVHAIDSFDRKVDAMKLIKETKDGDGQTLLLCSLCDEKLFRRKEIGAHLLSTHFDVFEQLSKGGDDGISPSWKCVECVEAPCFESEQLFYSHVKSCHPEKTKYCSQLNCYKLFSTQHSLRVHHGKEHSHAKFINPLCFEGGTYRRPRLRCGCCMTIFLRKPELMDHVKTLHPEAYWPCPHCQLMFYTEQQLTETHLGSCCRNPEVQRRKKVLKGKRGRPKRLPEKTVEIDKTESDSENYGKKDKIMGIAGRSLATNTRSSSRIKAKRKKNKSRVNTTIKNVASDDQKLKTEVKVLLTRLTKEQIDYYVFSANKS
ncbi:unnamed protein product [Orchesella dallaii]|uniref:C2H2-type domain-containing protein n=1 Tax=Orchesella dallaii TaxID=48710 RepID=A0ABP1RUI2_9HEXA